MPVSVLPTKLFIPPPPPGAQLRAALLARLHGGLARRLTLIAAPAGFGKTTLASAWATSSSRPAAWLALDEADNDPARFLAALIAALQTVAPTFGADVLALLQFAQPPPSDALLPPLISQIADLAEPVLLVLDDCHVLKARPVVHALAFLVDHVPPQLHIGLVARAEPTLPLARYRARGQLNELRAAELRFSAAETAAFLSETMSLSLEPAAIDALASRTEGWITGLQLAALSLQNHQDRVGFISTFAGDHRHILDYLVAEVLERQPAAMRSFLLQTAILDRLHGPLCDALTGQPHSAARLEALYRGNFFVEPLDDQRQWYRYHRLFADALAAQLLAEQPALVPALHQRASVWYEHNGLAGEAIRHAFLAHDHARAAGLIELAAPAMHQQRQEGALLAWLRALPAALIPARPVLSAYYAGTLLAVGELAGVAERLRDAERWLAPAPGATAIVRDPAALPRLPGVIAVYRAAQALALGDLPAAAASAAAAQALNAANDPLWSGAATALLGLATWASGDLEAAYRSFAAGLEQLRSVGNIADAIGGSLALADIRVTQGRLHAAQQVYADGLQLATAHGAPQLRGTADMLVGLSEICREQGDVDGAMAYMRRCQAQGEHTGFPQHPYRWRLAMARLRVAHGDLAGALVLLHEAERRYVGDFFPNVRPIAAWRARIWLAQGRLSDALGWVSERALSAHDELSYLREFEHVTLARVLLARAGEPWLREAIDLLERLCTAAVAHSRVGSLIEMLVVLARAHQLRGDLRTAQEILDRALALAEPEGFVRVFVDEGPPLAALLQGQSVASDPQLQRYRMRLLAACAADRGHQAGPAPARPDAFMEPLSQRERDVLRLLRSDLTGPEIARELIVSLNTLRTHTKNIYAKLGVSGRRAALRRATELGLL